MTQPDTDIVGLAQLPHLTEPELAVLLTAVKDRQRRLRPAPLRPSTDARLVQIGILHSLETAINEAIYSAYLDRERRQFDAEFGDD